MRVRIPLVAVLLLVSAAAHASGRPAAQPRSACELLTKADIAAVQGEEFGAAKPSSAGARSVCFYETPSFVNSVSIDVIQSGAKKYWKETFGEEAREKKEKESREEADGESEPKRVRGIGRDAYWTGGKQAGSLYVYSGGAVLRVSVGGATTEAQRIERSKQLAAAALKRLGR